MPTPYDGANTETLMEEERVKLDQPTGAKFRTVGDIASAGLNRLLPVQ